nr:PIN domain nuclease [Glycomyces amatae]
MSRWGLEPVKARLDPLLRRGLISICDATEYELLFSARDRAERSHLKAVMIPAFPWVPMGDNVFAEVLDLQQQLTDAGRHRCASMVDALLAVVAAREGLTILHYDRDFETIAAVTGQPVEWVVEPGTVLSAGPLNGNAPPAPPRCAAARTAQRAGTMTITGPRPRVQFSWNERFDRPNQYPSITVFAACSCSLAAP